MVFPVLWRHGDRQIGDLQAKEETASIRAALAGRKDWFNVKPVFREG
jgi:hypothetical protein